MTTEEKILWYDLLQKYPKKIYRQKAIGPYIVDFYCNEAKLVIEIDGEQHYWENNVEYDKKRSDFFSEIGIEVLRFDNEDITKNFDWVHYTIDMKILGESDVGKVMY